MQTNLSPSCDISNSMFLAFNIRVGKPDGPNLLLQSRAEASHVASLNARAADMFPNKNRTCKDARKADLNQIRPSSHENSVNLTL